MTESNRLFLLLSFLPALDFTNRYFFADILFQNNLMTNHEQLNIFVYKYSPDYVEQQRYTYLNRNINRFKLLFLLVICIIGRGKYAASYDRLQLK